MLLRKIAILLFVAFTNVVAVAQSADSCKMPALPSIYYKKGTVALSTKAKLTLDTVAVLARFFPKCKIRVSGYASSSYKSQALCWERVYSVINYLATKSITKNRLLFEYGLEGNSNYVLLRGTSKDGPSTAPRPGIY